MAKCNIVLLMRTWTIARNWRVPREWLSFPFTPTLIVDDQRRLQCI